MAEIAAIGGAVVDVLAQPVSEEVFRTGSYGVDGIRMSAGGDALNEATAIARLGRRAMLVTKLGGDAAGDYLRDHCRREGIHTYIAREPGVATSVNMVLVGSDGERRFLTAKNTSLRRLSAQDVAPALETAEFAETKIVCLASMFVSPLLDVPQMEGLFRKLREKGKLVCADSTRRKRGETVADVAKALRQLDYFFPNLEEAMLLTGEREPDAVADALLEGGVDTVVLKLGRRGCLVRNGSVSFEMSAYPQAVCLDTTGAGDCFTAAFMTALLEERPLRECAAFANGAASVCVEHLGAMPAAFTREEAEHRAKAILQG
ncbi:MAG: carbohydrate kinase family protein [Christensenellales bacterium]|nr:carbohydrate kinase family protein [Christensenellales bacterium]